MMKKDQINKLFKNFKKKYKDKYEDEELWCYIEENFWNFIDKNSAPDVLMQIYTELGIESPDGNFYKEHLKRLKERFDIRGNVLDVASGSIPAFANLLAHEQLKLGSGTVTLYEPPLSSYLSQIFELGQTLVIKSSVKNSTLSITGLALA